MIFYWESLIGIKACNHQYILLYFKVIQHMQGVMGHFYCELCAPSQCELCAQFYYEPCAKECYIPLVPSYCSEFHQSSSIIDCHVKSIHQLPWPTSPSILKVSKPYVGTFTALKKSSAVKLCNNFVPAITYTGCQHQPHSIGILGSEMSGNALYSCEGCPLQSSHGIHYSITCRWFLYAISITHTILMQLTTGRRTIPTYWRCCRALLLPISLPNYWTCESSLLITSLPILAVALSRG